MFSVAVLDGVLDKVCVGLPTAEEVRSWSHGEVKKPETFDYDSLQPVEDGLFSERIFGPTRDLECRCGRHTGIESSGAVCECCGVEVTRSEVRRERMGHIELVAPVTQIWLF